jgi:hypothetical protein
VPSCWLGWQESSSTLAAARRSSSVIPDSATSLTTILQRIEQ